MLETLDTSAYANPTYVADQRDKIVCMKTRLNTLLSTLVMEVDRNRMAFSLHVFQTMIIEKEGQLKRLYPKRPNNLWRHSVMGSSVPHPIQDDFADFPAPDSVEQFSLDMTAKFPDLFRRLEEKLADIRERYPDYQQYTWYHLATGGMRSLRSLPPSDFPGNDSLETFVRELYAEVIPRKHDPVEEQP